MSNEYRFSVHTISLLCLVLGIDSIVTHATETLGSMTGYIHKVKNRYYVSEYPTMLSETYEVSWEKNHKLKNFCLATINIACPKITVYFRSSTRTGGRVVLKDAYVGLAREHLDKKAKNMMNAF